MLPPSSSAEAAFTVSGFAAESINPAANANDKILVNLVFKVKTSFYQ
jgi:hypothetical protein